MNSTINIRIEFAGKNNIAGNHWLRDLSREIQQELGFPCNLETTKSPDNTMSGDIVSAIELLGVSIAAITLIWSIIKARRRGSITFEKQYKSGEKITLIKGNLTDAELQSEAQRLEDEIQKSTESRHPIIRIGD